MGVFLDPRPGQRRSRTASDRRVLGALSPGARKRFDFLVAERDRRNFTAFRRRKGGSATGNPSLQL